MARKARRVYPTAKPYPSYPLTPRADGRFVKRIRGVLHTYGKGGDWQGALDAYLATARARHAGRHAAQERTGAATVRQLANNYLAERDADVRRGALALRTWQEYREALDRFVKFAGPAAPPAELVPDLFSRFAQRLGRDLGSHAYNRTRALVFAWLRYCQGAEWCPPVNFGVGFRKVSAGKIRSQRKAKLLTPEQARAILAAAKPHPQLYAMCLLGLNGGYGATDCSQLEKGYVDTAAGVIRYARPKTHIARTVPLWPETAAALAPLLVLRPDDPLVFRTRHGAEWVRTERRKTRKGKTAVVTKDSVAMMFAKVCRPAAPGTSFYWLRHTFATYANEVRDADARRFIMGRALPDLDDVYVETVFLARLQSVTSHVREKLGIAGTA